MNTTHEDLAAFADAMKPGHEPLAESLRKFASSWKAEVGQLLANQIVQDWVQGGDVRYLGILLRKAIDGKDNGVAVWPCEELEYVRRWILEHAREDRAKRNLAAREQAHLDEIRKQAPSIDWPDFTPEEGKA